MDYRTLFDEKWLKCWDLNGKDWTLVIEKVEAGEIENQQKRTKERKPMIWFKGAKKPLLANKTICKVIATLYTNEVKNWLGKSLTLFPTTTQFGKETVDCIRVRTQIPKGKGQDLPDRPAPTEETSAEPGSEG